MKSLFLFCYGISFCAAACAQEKYYGSIARPSRETPETYRIMWKPYSDELLPSIRDFGAKEYLRLTNEKQILDLWKSEDDSVAGMVISWIDECANAEQTERSFTATHLLSATTASRIMRFADSVRVTGIPSNYPSRDSVLINDGFAYNVDYVGEGNHISKQHIKSDGRYIKQNGADTLIARMFTLARADSFLKNPLDKTPFQCSCWGAVGTCRTFFVNPSKWFYNETRQVNRQKKAYAQERKDYLKKFLKKDPAIFLP